MGVSSGRSRVVDHSFYVYGRAIHPEWFTVCTHARFSKTEWEADLRIIDGGHAISWASGSVRFTEILVGPDTALPEAGVLFQSPVRKEHTARLRPDPRVEYQTCFEVERLDAEVFAHVCEELLQDTARRDLFHQFPTSSRFGVAPLSRLHVETRGRGLTVSAFHTFPEERTIVRVQSLFEVIA